MRIVVVGTSGAGKTILARRIAAQLQLPHIELDAINWQSEWRDLTRHDPEEFVRRVTDYPGGGRQLWSSALVEGERRPAGYVIASESSRSFDDPGQFVEIALVNQIRPRVKVWREAGYPGVSGIHGRTSSASITYIGRASRSIGRT